MAGSSLRVVNPNNNTKSHTDLKDREAYYQHVLESIYRKSDGKNLASIIEQIQNTTRSVKFELIHITQDRQREVNLTKFEYNMSKDVLFVILCGQAVYEGTDLDYVKTSPSQITFNYDLKDGYSVFIVLAGTISLEGYGDDVYNSLNQFKQLVDTPDSYYGQGNRYVQVNDNETGLIFNNVKASNDLICIENDFNILNDSSFEGWINFVHQGMIKGIKLTPEDGYNGEFDLSIWDKPNGYWIYYSGNVLNILWDIMDIPHIDTSGQDCVYIKIINHGTNTNFKAQFFIVL